LARIVALDVGDATVGVAATDEMQVIVSPVKTIRRTAGIKADLRVVEALLSELEAEMVVIGDPVGGDGEVTIQTEKTRDFRDRLARRLTIPVVSWDERFTTSDAEDFLVGLDVSRRSRKRVIDSMAAVMILRGFLEDRERRRMDAGSSPA
jgi:putative holliday junction resolvase